jgi:uncharacterized protein (DUF1684 family)
MKFLLITLITHVPDPVSGVKKSPKGLEHHLRAVGVIDFDLAGTTSRLVVSGDISTGLQVLFTDDTSGVTTYPGARVLAIDPRMPAGR